MYLHVCASQIDSELKRNDSAPLQSYTNSIGDGVNDDTFYSPIGKIRLSMCFGYNCAFK